MRYTHAQTQRPGSSCVALSIDTSTSQCCLYSAFNDASLAAAANQFFYTQEQDGTCFSLFAPALNQECPQRQYLDGDGVLDEDYYAQYVGGGGKSAWVGCGWAVGGWSWHGRE
jgi:hypothetical protein